MPEQKSNQNNNEIKKKKSNIHKMPLQQKQILLKETIENIFQNAFDLLH